MRPARTAMVAVVAVLAASPARAEPPPLPLEPDWDAAYDRLVARERPRWLRAALEEAALVGAGAIWYWIDRERQVADWDFPSLKQRLTLEAWRYDNNPFPINFAWHAVDGAQYHLVGRTNELSLLASVGYGFVTSIAWEIGLEFREKVSINDTIVTTAAGTALGEFFHWLGRYLESAPDPRPWHAVARWALTPTRALHNALDGRAGLRPGMPPDRLGLSADIRSGFRVATGLAHGAPAGDAAGDGLALGELRLYGELFAIPGYAWASRLRRGFADGNVTRASLRLTGGADAVGIELLADTMLLGWHRQDVDAAGAGRATTVGVGLGYTYRRDLLGPWVERLALTHLPGLAVDHLATGEAWGRDAHVRARLRLHPDFAGLHAAAYGRWKAANPDLTERAILSKHGYYYGWGASARLELEAAVRPVAVGGALHLGRYASHDGLDRNQEDVTFDVDLADAFVAADAWLRVWPRGRLYVEARASWEDRDGRVGDVASRQSLRRLGIMLGASL